MLDLGISDFEIWDIRRCRLEDGNWKLDVGCSKIEE